MVDLRSEIRAPSGFPENPAFRFRIETDLVSEHAQVLAIRRLGTPEFARDVAPPKAAIGRFGLVVNASHRAATAFLREEYLKQVRAVATLCLVALHRSRVAESRPKSDGGRRRNACFLASNRHRVLPQVIVKCRVRADVVELFGEGQSVLATAMSGSFRGIACRCKPESRPSWKLRGRGA